MASELPSAENKVVQRQPLISLADGTQVNKPNSQLYVY